MLLRKNTTPEGVAVIGPMDTTFAMAPQPRAQQCPMSVPATPATALLVKPTPLPLPTAIVDAGANRRQRSRRWPPSPSLAPHAAATSGAPEPRHRPLRQHATTNAGHLTMPPATIIPRPSIARIRPRDCRIRPLGKGTRQGHRYHQPAMPRPPPWLEKGKRRSTVGSSRLHP
jgi:hypothetical protein